MAYELTYDFTFKNERQQTVEVYIYRKDVVPDDLLSGYEVKEFSIDVNGVNQDKYDFAYTRTMQLTFAVPPTDTATSWETFISGGSNEWKIIVLIDGAYYFHGFITPESGHGPLQDKPYTVTIRATDGLSLLKKIPFTNYDGSWPITYNRSTLVDLLTGSLKKTGLDLPIRIYCNLFHLVMQNRADSISNDMFAVTKITNRSLLKDINTYISCWDVLEFILGRFCHLSYWNGMWVVTHIMELQFPVTPMHYTNYQEDGTVINGVLEDENHAQFGKGMDIFPINQNQEASARFANKSVRHTFDYKVGLDLFVNEKVQRLGSFISPISGIGYSAYQLYEWSQFQEEVDDIIPYVGAALAYIKVEVDDFGNQVDRYMVVEADSAATGDLQHQIRHNNFDFLVTEGDKIRLSVTQRTLNDEGGIGLLLLAKLVLLVEGTDGSSATDWWSVNAAGVWTNNSGQTFATVASATDTDEWQDHEIEETKLPASGTLMLLLGSGGVADGNEVHYKNIDYTYTPQISGARLSVKGQWVQRTQATDYTDNATIEQPMADAPVKILNGVMWWSDGSNDQLLDPSWYMWDDATTVRPFMNWLNYAYFNHYYRRYYQIEGEFKGLEFAPENDSTDKQPIGFHKRYRHVDLSPQREYMLIAPLKMNMVKGWVNAIFVEVINTESTEDIGGGISMDDVLIGIVAALNQAGIDHSEDLTATIFAGAERTIRIVANPTVEADGSVDVNGAGNSPSITKTFANDGIGGFRTHFQIGEDLAAGNIFTINIYGFDVDYEVGDGVTTERFIDGTRNDGAEFGYNF